MDPFIEELRMESFLDLEIGQNAHENAHWDDKQIPIEIPSNNQSWSKCKDLLTYISEQSKLIFLENEKSNKGLLKRVNGVKANSR